LLGAAVEHLNKNERYDRLIVITDEQAHDSVPAPRPERIARRSETKTRGRGSPDSPFLAGWGGGYVVNVASYRNGVGYGKWMHIDGWSDAVIDYIRALELASNEWVN
jgi:hypothetical protein